MPLAVYSATITRILQLTPTVRQLTLTLHNNATIPFHTGQWVYLHLNNNGTILKRAFSIASSAHQPGVLDFCVKKVEGGIGSAIIFSLHEGDPVSLSGPFGHFTLKPTTRDLVFIATGSGIAPFRPMLHDLIRHHASNTITLFFGTRTEDELIYRDEMEKTMKSHNTFHYYPILSRGAPDWNGDRGHVQELVKKYIHQENKNQDFYICGLKEMVLSVKELLEQMGVPKEQIYFERYN